jgi:hypothetical protein
MTLDTCPHCHQPDRLCRVWICPADSHTGVGRWAWKAVDACIADVVEQLNSVGAYTRSSCCGHGRTQGHILLLCGMLITLDTRARLCYAGRS